MTQITSQLEQLALSVIGDATSERDRARRVHDFVRDSIRYGFTSRFDEATPTETLEAGIGHCNPQTRLFVELARAAGLEAKLHYVTISGEILRGVLPNSPARISHGFAEVRVDSRWYKVDSYIIDREHASGAAARLLREGRRVGYGFHIAGSVDWDGASDSFSQLADPAMILEDHGTFESAEDFYRSDAFSHRIGPVSFSTMLSALPSPFFRAFTALVDGQLGRLRRATPLVTPVPQAA